MYREGLETAVRLLTTLDPRLLEAARVTFTCSLVATLFAALLGVPVAMALGRRRGRWVRVALVTARTGMAVPTVVIGLLLYGLLTRKGLLGDLGILYTPTAMIVGQFFLALPIVVALCVESFEGLHPETESTARTLGAGAWRVRLTLLREAQPGVIAASMAAFGRVVSELGIAIMLGGNIAGHTRTMTTTIALETSKGLFALSLAIGFVLLLFALLLNLLVAIGRTRAR